MDKNTLTKVGKWAQSRVASGEEPPWTYHRLKQLAEISLELAEGLGATVPLDIEDMPVEAHAQPALAENIVQLESFRTRSDTANVILPT